MELINIYLNRLRYSALHCKTILYLFPSAYKYSSVVYTIIIHSHGIIIISCRGTCSRALIPLLIQILSPN